MPNIESLGSNYNSTVHGELNSIHGYETSEQNKMVGFVFEYVESRSQTRIGFVNLGEYDA